MSSLCDCEDYKKYIKMIDDCIVVSALHHVPLPDDYKSFEYCPWCGTDLIRNCESCKYDDGKGDLYNPSCIRCDNGSNWESKFND